MPGTILFNVVSQEFILHQINVLMLSRGSGFAVI